jgi:hypothetical protein
MKSVLMRFGRLLDREEGVATRHFALGAHDEEGGRGRFEPVSSNPMHKLIRLREMVGGGLHVDDPRWESYVDDFGMEIDLEITAYGDTAIYPTWFDTKKSVQLFLDVLSAQVKPGTSPEVFAEVAAGFIRLQKSPQKRDIVTIVGEVWQNERSEVAKVIAPVFLAGHVPSPLTPVISEAEDGWLRVLIRSGLDGDRASDRVVLWHLPPDVRSHLTMVVAQAQYRVQNFSRQEEDRWRTVDPASPEYVPPWSRFITSGATCSLFYHTRDLLFFPLKAHRGSGVTCVEYMSNYGGGEYYVKQVTALANLFKPDADPIVVGLGYQVLDQLHAFSLRGSNVCSRYVHHWHVMWPKEYRRQFQSTTRVFFKRLLRMANPQHYVGCRRVPSGRGVQRFEFVWWWEHEGDTEPRGLRFCDCVVDRSQIMLKFASKSMLEASDADTDEDVDEDVDIGPDHPMFW